MRRMALGMTMAVCMFAASGCQFRNVAADADASAVQASLEWRLASYAPRDGYTEADYRGRPVYLAAAPMLRVDRAATVKQAEGGDDRPALDLRFPGHGAQLTRATEQNVGKPVALLADGKVLTVATIMSPLPGDNVQISGLQDVQEQQRVFALLTHAPAARDDKQ